VTGTVRGLALRAAGSLRPESVQGARALAGQGFAGDRHAEARSPRQLLLVDAAAYEDFALPPHALRENLLLDIDTAALASGTVLGIGNDVRLRLMFQCEACGQLDRQRPGLARALGPRRGMLARIIAGGTVRVGDTVRDLGRLAPPWSDDWRERVRQVLDAMPPGAVVEYRQLARLAGIQSSYCRAFPRLLAKLGPAYAARAVPANANAATPRWQGEGLFDLPPDASGAA
jgi:MOSC domain-containing protein YiiM